MQYLNKKMTKNGQIAAKLPLVKVDYQLVDRFKTSYRYKGDV